MKTVTTLLMALLVSSMLTATGHAWGGPKGPQFVSLEGLASEQGIAKALEDLTDDTKGKYLKNVKKVFIPSYPIQFRVASGGIFTQRDWKSTNFLKIEALVKWVNADPAVLQEITDAAYADYVAQLTAAGFEVVSAKDIVALPPYKTLKVEENAKKWDTSAVGSSLAKWMRTEAIITSAAPLALYFKTTGALEPGKIMPGSDNVKPEVEMWEQLGGTSAGTVAWLRPSIQVDFVKFIGDGSAKYDDPVDIFGTKIPVGEKEKKWTLSANISAIPQISILSGSVAHASTFVHYGSLYSVDNFGALTLNGKITLASPVVGTGKIESVSNDEFAYTADLPAFKAAAIEQLKIFNRLMVAKAKSFKQ